MLSLPIATSTSLPVKKYMRSKVPPAWYPSGLEALRKYATFRTPPVCAFESAGLGDVISAIASGAAVGAAWAGAAGGVVGAGGWVAAAAGAAGASASGSALEQAAASTSAGNRSSVRKVTLRRIDRFSMRVPSESICLCPQCPS